MGGGGGDCEDEADADAGGPAVRRDAAVAVPSLSPGGTPVGATARLEGRADGGAGHSRTADGEKGVRRCRGEGPAGKMGLRRARRGRRARPGEIATSRRVLARTWPTSTGPKRRFLGTSGDETWCKRSKSIM